MEKLSTVLGHYLVYIVSAIATVFVWFLFTYINLSNEVSANTVGRDLIQEVHGFMHELDGKMSVQAVSMAVQEANIEAIRGQLESLGKQQ